MDGWLNVCKFKSIQATEDTEITEKNKPTIESLCTPLLISVLSVSGLLFFEFYRPQKILH